MVLDPINSITSVNFYKKVAVQGLGRTLLYLAYMGLIYGVFATLWLQIHLLPGQRETFQWLETNVPTITYSNGRLSTPANEPVTIRHPRLPQLAFTIDTGRSEPVTPQMFQDHKVVAYVAANAMYLMQPGGKVEAFDFSKTPGVRSAVLDAKLWRKLSQAITRIEYPLVFVSCFLLFFVWKIFAALFFSLLARIVNSVTETGLEYQPLFNISAYAQTLSLAFTAVIMLVWGVPPFLHLFFAKFNLTATLLTAAYIWLAVKRQAAPLPQTP